MNDIAVSVIVPAYNMEKYLRRCAESVLGQTLADFELIIVDDGSTDGTARVCDELEKQDPRVRVIRQKNAGVGMARNAALDIAGGEFVQFVDADDAIAPTLLKDATDAARETGADFVFFGVTDQSLNSDGQYRDDAHFNCELSGYLPRREVYANFRKFIQRSFSCAFRMYRRSYIERLRLRFGTQGTEEDGLFNMAAYGGDFTGIYFLRKEYYLRFTRPGSAVNRYHKDRFSNQMNAVNAIVGLIKHSGYGDTDEGRAYIARQYIKCINIALRNDAMPGANLSLSRRKSNLKSWLEVPEIAKSMKDVGFDQFDSAPEKIKFWLLRKRWLTLALLMQSLYVVVRPQI